MIFTVNLCVLILLFLLPIFPNIYFILISFFFFNNILKNIHNFRNGRGDIFLEIQKINSKYDVNSLTSFTPILSDAFHDARCQTEGGE